MSVTLQIPAAEPTTATSPEWKLEKQKKPGGLYFILTRGQRTGGEDTRASIALGVIGDVEAADALAGINYLRLHGKPSGEQHPTPDRLIAYLRNVPSDHDSRRAARERVLEILVPIGRALREAQNDGTPDAAVLLALDPTVAGGPGLPMDYAAMTLRAYMDGVWKPIREKKKAATWKKEIGLWQGYILPALGGLRMRDLDPTENPKTAHVHFDKLIRSATLKDGSPASGNTKRLIRAAYAACIKEAARSGHIGAVHAYFPIEGSTERVMPEAEPLTSEEIAALLDAAGGLKFNGGDKDGAAMHRCLFAVTVAQGLRPSEVRRLDWSHLDLDGARLRVPGKKTKKSKATIPLFPLAVEELREWKMRCGRPDAGPVFTWQGKPLTGEQSFKRSLATAAKKAGITKNVTPYVLRHTFATRSLEAGAGRDEVAAVMRHTNPKMVQEHYDHADTSRTIDASTFEAWQTRAK
jgi:integrase